MNRANAKWATLRKANDKIVATNERRRAANRLLRASYQADMDMLMARWGTGLGWKMKDGLQ